MLSMGPHSNSFMSHKFQCHSDFLLVSPVMASWWVKAERVYCHHEKGSSNGCMLILGILSGWWQVLLEYRSKEEGDWKEVHFKTLWIAKMCFYTYIFPTFLLTHSFFRSFFCLLYLPLLRLFYIFFSSGFSFLSFFCSTYLFALSSLYLLVLPTCFLCVFFLLFSFSLFLPCCLFSLFLHSFLLSFFHSIFVHFSLPICFPFSFFLFFFFLSACVSFLFFPPFFIWYTNMDWLWGQ